MFVTKERATLYNGVRLIHQGSLHWCIPRNHGDTRCRKVTVQSAGAKRLCISTHLCCLTRCCSPERWWIPVGNVCPCARRNTGRPPRSGYRPRLYPLKNTGVTNENQSDREADRQAARERLPGHLQPSTQSSLQTSRMLRLWQVVEQDLVHSLYCIPTGHLGTKEDI